MKIVKRIEDIQGDMWCFATKENYEFLKNLGCKFTYDKFEKYQNHIDFIKDDVFQFTNQNFDCLVNWLNILSAVGENFICEQEPQGSLLSRLEFLEPETFKVEILKIFGGVGFVEYIGTINECAPAKWNSEGICLIPSEKYNLYKEYNQKIYTKPNSPGFFPKQKFTISSTEKMSTSLEKQGWKLATNEQIEGFKDV